MEFIKLAEENCLLERSVDVSSRSKKIAGLFNPKMPFVQINVKDEMSSKIRLEKSLVSQYVDFSMIPLIILKKSPQLFLKTIRSRNW